MKLTVQVSDGALRPIHRDPTFRGDGSPVSPGQRVFDVRIQGQDAAAGLDVVAVAGDTDRAWSRQFRDVATERTLTLELVPVKGKPPVICAIEVLRQS